MPWQFFQFRFHKEFHFWNSYFYTTLVQIHVKVGGWRSTNQISFFISCWFVTFVNLIKILYKINNIQIRLFYFLSSRECVNDRMWITNYQWIWSLGNDRDSWIILPKFIIIRLKFALKIKYSLEKLISIGYVSCVSINSSLLKFLFKASFLWNLYSIYSNQFKASQWLSTDSSKT